VVLLNLDAGEYDSEPEELWALADILSIACGGHAGDERSMARVVAFCAAREKPRIGAHPSYPDRANFGRVSVPFDFEALRASIADQCRALARIAADHGARVAYVKPHGALYHDANKELGAAGAVVFGAREALGKDVVFIGPGGGLLEDLAHRFGPHTPDYRYLREGFADRGTRPDGSLIPRTDPGALITDPAASAARARELMANVDTICVHADTPGSLPIARAVRAALDA
jgi:UPF0271 protein